jgi:phosphate transport system substrate-binding protein
MHNFLRLASAVLIYISTFSQLHAERPIRIVGSSGVYSFVTMVAERFGRTTDFRTPIVEATGTGGGIKIFCGGPGKTYPDVVNTSRPMSDHEKKYCAKNGVEEVLELKIGYDGIVIGAHPSQTAYALTRQDLSKALSEFAETPEGFVRNPYTTWAQINPDLPNSKISVLGPTSTLATREVFEEKVIREGCQASAIDKAKCKGSIREDGAFIEVAEHESVIIQKLELKPESIGFVSYGYYTQNPGKIKPISIDGVLPSIESISSNTYPLSRPLFIYVKKTQLKRSPALKAFLEELFSDQASGPNGYLLDKGLIPLSTEERETVKREIYSIY